MERHALGHTEAGRLTVPGHIARVTHSYFVHYPPHDERPDDPHYKDFNAYRRKTREFAQCVVGQHRNDFSECFPPQEHWPIGLELHHTHIEFALQQGIDLSWLDVDYPEVGDPTKVGAWVESAKNLEWRCIFHHRGVGGVHTLTASDYEGVKYVKGLTSK